MKALQPTEGFNHALHLGNAVALPVARGSIGFSFDCRLFYSVWVWPAAPTALSPPNDSYSGAAIFSEHEFA